MRPLSAPWVSKWAKTPAFHWHGVRPSRAISGIGRPVAFEYLVDQAATLFSCGLAEDVRDVLSARLGDFQY